MLTIAKGDQGVFPDIYGGAVSAGTVLTALDAAEHWIGKRISDDGCLRPQAEFPSEPVFQSSAQGTSKAGKSLGKATFGPFCLLTKGARLGIAQQKLSEDSVTRDKHPTPTGKKTGRL
ncbi:hypothetical protein [Motiliproteus sp.]|uniref:hypothetical protein n=1 Tax=Motiliproteus sp. TaxID=1898955 RepID=UPI003BAC8047